MRSKCWDACKEGNLPVFGYQPRSPPAKYDGGGGWEGAVAT